MPSHVAIIKRLVQSMEHATDIGCVDHLDCSIDSGAFWYNAIKDAKNYLLDYSLGLPPPPPPLPVLRNIPCK